MILFPAAKNERSSMFQLVEAAFLLVVGILVLPPLAVAAHVVISVVCGVAAAIYSMIMGE